MARPLRLEFAGGLYHVMSRGDRRDDIFLNDSDRFVWVDLLGAVCERFGWVCHAWCQMGNHYHLVIETPVGGLARGMRHLNGVYTQYVNRVHQRVGHVFQGRYKAILVEKDRHLLELARYVVLNPVRAGWVNDPGDWPWSSYSVMLGEAPPPGWLQTDWLLAQFASEHTAAVARYRDFVRAGIGLPPVWADVHGQVFLGSADFIGRMQASIGVSSAEVPRAQRHPQVRPVSCYVTDFDDPHTGMAAAYASGDHTMQAIARAFGVHYSTVSRAVRREEMRRSMLECKT